MHTTPDTSENLDLLVTRVGLAENLPVFSRFRLKRILGKGGMGVVWLAQDEKANREVALKFMPDIVAGNATALQDMRRETRNGIKLSHQNVVTMYDLVEENESAAIIMEYVKGGNLDIMRRNQPNQVFEASSLESYMNQLLDALDYAHNVAKMVHRDLKPANLMVDANDVLKVADFGIARNLKDTVSRISMKLNGAGTLSYMSPQQMMGDNPTSMDDIYALGATIYELLTGKPPFHTGDIATQVESRIPPRMSERRQEYGIRGAAIPEAWETVVAACLEKRPEDRPADIEAIRQGLRGQKFRRLSGQTTTRRSTQPKKNSPAPAGGLSITKIAIAAALVIGAAGFFLGGREKREPTTTTSTPTTEAGAEDESLKTTRENVEALKKITSADFGSAWAYHMISTEALKKIRRLAVPGDAAWQELIDDVTRLERQAASEETREKNAYAANLKTLDEAIIKARTESARQDLNAEGKAKVWQDLLTSMEGMSLNEDYGRGHEALQQEALVAFNRHQAQSLTGAKASLASGADVLTSEEMRSWSAGEKEVIIKRVQQNLQQKGLYQGTLDGKHGLKLHEALIAYQKQEQMPTTARIDDSVLTRLNVDKARPPQQVVVTRNVGGGGGSSSGSRPSGGGSSGVPEQIMRWSGAMGAIGNARSAWGR